MTIVVTATSTAAPVAAAIMTDTNVVKPYEHAYEDFYPYGCYHCYHRYHSITIYPCHIYPCSVYPCYTGHQKNDGYRVRWWPDR